MWELEATKRPKMDEVVQLLALPKYWVPGTDPDEFQRYVTFVDQEEGDILRNNKADDEAWKPFMDNSTSALAVSAKLASDPANTTFEAKVIHAIAILSGKAGAENTKLRERLREQLEANDSFKAPEAAPFDGQYPRLEEPESPP
jgi:hypothetical protein